jgi:hypothetical protein
MGGGAEMNKCKRCGFCEESSNHKTLKDEAETCLQAFVSCLIEQETTAKTPIEATWPQFVRLALKHGTLEEAADFLHYIVLLENLPQPEYEREINAFSEIIHSAAKRQSKTKTKKTK